MAVQVGDFAAGGVGGGGLAGVSGEGVSAGCPAGLPVQVPQCVEALAEVGPVHVRSIGRGPGRV